MWLAAAYVGSGMLGLGLDIAHDSATPVWAPTGISLAALLLYGRWLWPAVAVGAFAVNTLDSASVPFALIAAAGKTLSVVLAHELILRHGGATPSRLLLPALS